MECKMIGRLYTILHEPGQSLQPCMLHRKPPPRRGCGEGAKLGYAAKGREHTTDGSEWTGGKQTRGKVVYSYQ